MIFRLCDGSKPAHINIILVYVDRDIPAHEAVDPVCQVWRTDNQCLRPSKNFLIYIDVLFGAQLGVSGGERSVLRTEAPVPVVNIIDYCLSLCVGKVYGFIYALYHEPLHDDHVGAYHIVIGILNVHSVSLFPHSADYYLVTTFTNVRYVLADSRPP